MKNTQNNSWSLYESSSSFSDLWENNFEEVNCGDVSSCSSYEVIDDGKHDGNIIELLIENSDLQPNEDSLKRSTSQVSERGSSDEFSEHIKSTAKSLLNTPEKQEEIKAFENLFKRFDQWCLEKKKSTSNLDDPEAWYSEICACKFLIHDKNLNTFLFPFSDVHANIVVSKQSQKTRIQSLFAEFLRETEPYGLIKEYNTKQNNNNKEIVFRFPLGKTKFIITVGLDFRLRLNQYIKLCANIDKRYITLGTYLSYWAHQRKIFSEDFLNPYALYFMLIYFLMNRRPPILPKLMEEDIQKMNVPKTLFKSLKRRKQDNDQGKSIIIPILPEAEKMIQNDENLKAATDPSLKELLTQFYYTFAFEVPKLKKTLSVRTGNPGKSVQGYSVEDPFNSQYDLCKNLNNNKNKIFNLVKSEFERAYNLISEGKFPELCQEKAP